MKTYSRKNSSYLRKAFFGSNFDEMCRLCLSEANSGLKPIFQELNKISYPEWIQNGYTLKEWIQYGVDISVEEEDGLPPNVCEECVLMVEQIYLFKKKCKASDSKLREHLELLDLEEGRFNNRIKDKDVFSKEDSSSDINKAVKSEEKDSTQLTNQEIPSDPVRTSTPTEEKQPKENVKVKRYILKGEISADNLEEDLTVCEVVPLEDKTPSIECIDENELSESSQDTRIQEIYKQWGNEEETELSQVSNYNECKVVVVPENSADNDENVEEKVCVKTRTNKNEVMIVEEIPETATYSCSSCDTVCLKYSDLMEHLAEYHKNAPVPAFCKTCGKSFTCRNSLKRHMAVHTGFRPYQCQTCFRRFSQGSILKRHELVHTALKPYSCEICGKSYTQKLNLLTHLKNHGFRMGQDRYRCTTCNKSFVHQSGLSRHRKMHGGVRYLCAKCKKSFVDPSALTRHFKTIHILPG